MNDIPAVISLGAGVQSTTLLLMACHGEIEPRPIEAIFADTGWEPQAVYDHLAWLESISTIPITRVQKANLREEALKKSIIPAYSKPPEGRGGPMMRACTRDYKVRPLTKRQRQLMKERGDKHMLVMMGISLDEATRMKPNHLKSLTNVFPLIDKRMTRLDCLRWLLRHGYPEPPKSACIGCPYHGDDMWKRLKENDPNGWADAVAFDEQIRDSLPRARGRVYLHRSMIPLVEVDLSGQPKGGQMSLWDLECEGMCGV